MPSFFKVLSTFPGIVFFLLITTLFANNSKTMQINAVCSSKIVVKISGNYYSNFLVSFETPFCLVVSFFYEMVCISDTLPAFISSNVPRLIIVFPLRISFLTQLEYGRIFPTNFYLKLYKTESSLAL